MALTKVGKEGVTGISNSSNATAITIDSSERVGIGHASPTAPLDVRISGASGLIAEFHNTSGFGVDIGSDSDSVSYISGGYTQELAFKTNAGSGQVERMRLNSSGNLLIGRTNTNSNNGGHFITSDYAFFEDNGAPLFLNRFSSDGSIAIFRKQNSNVGDISVTGSGTSYNTSSDYRLKENVTYDWDATTRLKQLKPARFNFIVDADTTVDGFLAHEAQAVVPESVTGTKDEVDADGNPIMQGIDQSKIVPLLVKTLQEAITKIETLETKVQALEDA